MSKLSEAETAARTSLSFLGEPLVECLDRFAGEIVQRQLNLIDRTLQYGKAWYGAEKQGVRRLLCGILYNAVSHGPHGGTVLLSCYAVDDGHIRICVTDNGPGIPANQLALLNRGSPVYSSEDEIPSLAEWPAIAGRIEGRVGAAGTPGEGSTVWMELPGCIESWRTDPIRYSG